MAQKTTKVKKDRISIVIENVVYENENAKEKFMVIPTGERRSRKKSANFGV